MFFTQTNHFWQTVVSLSWSQFSGPTSFEKQGNKNAGSMRHNQGCLLSPALPRARQDREWHQCKTTPVMINGPGRVTAPINSLPQGQGITSPQNKYSNTATTGRENLSQYSALHCAHEHSTKTDSYLVSNWILISCQLHRVTSGQWNSGHKQIHISKLFSSVDPLLGKSNQQARSIHKY